MRKQQLSATYSINKHAYDVCGCVDINFLCSLSPSLIPSHLNRGRLEQLVAEHLDHLHYISDILSLNVQSLNDVIIDHLLNRLLIPLYVYSLTDQALDSDDVNIIFS